MATPMNGAFKAIRLASGASLGEMMVAVVAGLGMFLAALDIAVNVALPAMTRDFKTDLQTVQWIIVAFVATRAGLAMGAGSFADQFGLRPVYLFGAATYLVSMFLIAFSPSLGMAVGFRVLQGLGTGCLYAVSPAIAARVFPAHRRGLAMGLTTASQAFGMLAGTLGAGLLVRWFDWEAVFLGRVPFALLALFLAVRFMKKKEARPDSGPPFDLVGAVTLIAALLCLVIGLRLGRSAGWSSLAVLVLLPLSPVLLTAFWRAEKHAAWPVLPGELLRVRGFLAAGLSMFLAHLGVFVIWFIFPFYIADSLGRGALSLGVMLAAMALLNTGFSGVGGWLCDRAGTLPVGLAGLVILAGGLFFMGLLDGGAGLAQVGYRIAIVGIGLGLFQAAAYALMMSSVPSERFGTAAAALSLAQAFGSVLSVAIIGGVFAFINDHHLGTLAQQGIASADLEGRAFIQAFHDVFWLGGAIAALGAGAFLLSWRRRGSAG
jgi:MFS family permease